MNCLNESLPDFLSDRIKQLFEVYCEKRDEIFNNEIINNVNMLYNTFFKKDNILFDKIIFNLFNKDVFKFYSLTNEQNEKFNNFIKKYLFLLEKYKLEKNVLKMFANLLDIDIDFYFLDVYDSELIRVDDYEYIESDRDNRYRSNFVEVVINLFKRYDNYLWYREKDVDVKKFINDYRFILNRYIYTLFFSLNFDLNLIEMVDEKTKIKMVADENLINSINAIKFDDNKIFDNNLKMDFSIEDIINYFKECKIYYNDTYLVVKSKRVELIGNYLEIEVEYRNYKIYNNNIFDIGGKKMDDGVYFDNINISYDDSDYMDKEIKKIEFFLGNNVYFTLYIEYNSYKYLYLYKGDGLNFILRMKII